MSEAMRETEELNEDGIMFMIDECNKFVLNSHKQKTLSVYEPKIRDCHGHIVSVNETSSVVDFWLQF